MQYLPHQQRVVDEKAELDLKREKLREFIDTSPVHAALEMVDKKDLMIQSFIMAQYSDVLFRRICRFK
jgi:hypothetical protein